MLLAVPLSRIKLKRLFDQAVAQLEKEDKNLDCNVLNCTQCKTLIHREEAVESGGVRLTGRGELAFCQVCALNKGLIKHPFGEDWESVVYVALMLDKR